MTKYVRQLIVDELSFLSLRSSNNLVDPFRKGLEKFNKNDI